MRSCLIDLYQAPTLNIEEYRDVPSFNEANGQHGEQMEHNFSSHVHEVEGKYKRVRRIKRDKWPEYERAGERRERRKLS